MTQEHSSGLLLTASGIQHRVPRRTVSKHTALQFPEVYGYQHFGISPTSTPLFRSTCPTSPGVRLSRTQTTIGTPSPWGSRPLGNLAFFRCLRSSVLVTVSDGSTLSASWAPVRDM